MRGQDHSTDDGGQFYYVGDFEQAEKEYHHFRSCIAQLLDESTMVGDVDQRWIIFQHGWVADLSSYETKDEAIKVGQQMFRSEPDATYLILHVDCDTHAITAMHILGSAISEADGFDLSTTPDERNRKAGDEV